MTIHVVLVGGGLANSLIAYRLAQQRPDVDLTLIEQQPRLGGNHLWSFHDADLSPTQRSWVEPFVAARWPRYEVRFPSLRRTLESGYNSVSSERLDEAVRAALTTGARRDGIEHHLLTGTTVASLAPDAVTLADGRKLAADLVVDGRGMRSSASFSFAWQKFVGQHLELAEEHGLTHPILMDATVEQRDGFRFLYTLPLSRRSLLVEDTRYADSPRLDRDEMRSEIGAYAERAGWRTRHVVREEQGVLPIVLGGDADTYWAERPAGLPQSGLRALLFHPTTGYSLPEAVRLADAIASSARLASEQVDGIVRRRSSANWKRHGYFRLLNRMLFQAARPEDRFKVLQRFYRLRQPLIERFYAGKPSIGDRIRILTGRPPLPLRAAMACLTNASARTTAHTVGATESPHETS